ncbi:dual specificity protein phosphatase family protein [Bacillus tianshenii]|uniref:protein-tyrosine phosphatase family protein n=1 Tax=Sutcliffiella tianshenii TaxID=1463404 RepID=UPI001CD67C4E|nr:dual specificity protein phosphatase family protein [Bacillus tianshenii]MCA1318948.1 dual specificity protein phosphatase family protein [Bacillus tianshenii]
MPQEKSYQALMENIFIGGADQAREAHQNEGLDVIIDLRAESDNLEDGLPRIHLPIVDDEAKQDESVKRAIDYVVQAQKEGKKVYFHCSGGRNRTGTVAMGTLLQMGKANTVEDAEKQAVAIRPIINVKPELKEVLHNMYQK